MAAAGSGSSTPHVPPSPPPCMNGSPSSSGGMGEAATSEAGGCAGLPVRSRLAEEPLMSIGFKSSYSIDVDGLLGGKLGENDGDVPGNISDDRYA